MKSFRGSNQSLVNTFQTLSLNTSAANGTLGTFLVNEQHKLLLLRYFDNERAYTMTTVGSGTSATVTSQIVGGTNATLTGTWANLTCNQLVTFTDGTQRNVQFINNSKTISWQSPLTATAGTTITLAGVQFYPLPANVSKVKNGTITVGQLVYSPAPVQSIQEWTKLNALPYNSAIPAYFYIYNNQIGFWPIPSSTGNIITLNCQIEISDMTYSDYSTGTITGMTVNSSAITGSTTSWNTTGKFPLNVDLTFSNLFLVVNPPQGDGLYYQIQSFQSDTTLTLLKPVVNSPNVTGATYTIGQYPLLSPDFQDTIVYGALRVYFSSIVKDADKYTLYNNLFQERLDLMKFYLGTKQVNVDLSDTPSQYNPNLYYFGNGRSI